MIWIVKINQRMIQPNYHGKLMSFIRKRNWNYDGQNMIILHNSLSHQVPNSIQNPHHKDPHLFHLRQCEDHAEPTRNLHVDWWSAKLPS
jgi:hypothetical protein